MLKLSGLMHNRAGNERQQVDIVAPVESQVLHLLLIDHVGDLAGDGIESLGLSRDLHRLGSGADLQDEIRREARIARHNRPVWLPRLNPG